jgi:hypothetical protein
MTLATDHAFDAPVHLQCASDALIRTVDEAVSIVRSNLRGRFTMQGLNTLLMLERAAEGTEVEEARRAFCLWASNEGLA